MTISAASVRTKPGIKSVTSMGSSSTISSLSTLSPAESHESIMMATNSSFQTVNTTFGALEDFGPNNRTYQIDKVSKNKMHYMIHAKQRCIKWFMQTLVQLVDLSLKQTSSIFHIYDAFIKIINIPYFSRNLSRLFSLSVSITRVISGNHWVKM